MWCLAPSGLCCCRNSAQGLWGLSTQDPRAGPPQAPTKTQTQGDSSSPAHRQRLASSLRLCVALGRHQQPQAAPKARSHAAPPGPHGNACSPKHIPVVRAPAIHRQHLCLWGCPRAAPPWKHPQNRSPFPAALTQRCAGSSTVRGRRHRRTGTPLSRTAPQVRLLSPNPSRADGGGAAGGVEPRGGAGRGGPLLQAAGGADGAAPHRPAPLRAPRGRGAPEPPRAAGGIRAPSR